MYSRLLFQTGMSFSLREWGLLAAGSAACMAVAYAVAHGAGVPVLPGDNGSLLAGVSAGRAIVVAVGVIVVGLVLGAAVAGPLGVEASVFCGGLGLAVLAVRCGPMRGVLAYAAGRGVFLKMAVEAVVLGGVTVGGWWLLDRAARAMRASAGPAGPTFAVPGEVTDATVGQKLSATGITVLVMVAVQLLLVQTAGAKQCLAGVAIASFLATITGYGYLPMGEGAWYWAAPVVVAVVGYLAAFVTNDLSPTAELHGFLAGLGRPTPLQYVSLGMPAGVLAHWVRRRWAMEDEPPVLADPEAVAP